MRKEIPNIICFFRIAVSLLLAVLMPNNWFDGVIFSLALISDIFDGYFYRKLEEKPYHWFNRLPISMDPIADFIFGTAGLIIGYRSGLISMTPIVITLLLSITLNFILHKVKNDFVWSLIANLLTYGWFAIMILADYVVWNVSIERGNLIAFGITIIIYHFLYVSFRDKNRTIRKRG